MSKYIYSTLTLSAEYVDWQMRDEGQLPLKGRSVTIQGGANVPSKSLVTPLGVVTKVSDEDYEFLKENRVFKLQIVNGNIKVHDREHKVEKVVRDMTSKDGSSPLTPDDFPDGDEPVVPASGPEDEPTPISRRRRGRSAKGE